MAELVDRLKDLAFKGEHGYLSPSDYELTFETVMVEVSSDKIILKNTIPFQHIAQVTQSKDFTLQFGKDRFKAKNLTSDGIHLVMEMEPLDAEETMRHEPREVPSDDAKMVVKILNPFDGETELLKPVLDLSASGMSLRTRNESRLFSEGVHLPLLEITLNGKSHRKEKGTIVYVRPYLNIAHEKYCQVGIRFD